MLIILSTNAQAISNFSYIGVDVLFNKANLKQGYGGDFFNNTYSPQMNIFVGYYFAHLLGFECGYEQTFTVKKTSFIPASTGQFGLANFTGIVSNTYDTKKTLRGFNINYVPQINLGEWISIVPVLGVAYMKTVNDLDLTEFDGLPETSEESDEYGVHFSATKLIPRFGVRVQYLITKKLGIRASYIWENTALLEPQATRRINPNQILTAKLENSNALGLGVFYRFL